MCLRVLGKTLVVAAVAAGLMIHEIDRSTTHLLGRSTKPLVLGRLTVLRVRWRRTLAQVTSSPP
ncbi:hypothetical protein VR41_10060 [Streptomyces sp. NRRL B-1568]|nr:hypothetical protein VR41_10060 [Streptomyces sp. NRRL B-1568]